MATPRQRLGMARRYPTIPDTVVGRLTHIAYFKQEQLGWEQALRGRLSKRWGEAQDQYYKDRQHTEHLTGNIWMTRIIHALWEYSKAIWMERNAAYHGADDHGHNSNNPMI
jgi:hypothetical protein